MQVFSPAAVLVIKVATLGGVAAIAGGLVTWRLAARDDAPLASPIEQPVPFSHRHHVGDDGIDCRYCHASVETSSTARIPPLETCMTCHSQLFTDALAILRLAAAAGVVWLAILGGLAVADLLARGLG